MSNGGGRAAGQFPVFIDTNGNESGGDDEERGDPSSDSDGSDSDSPGQGADSQTRRRNRRAPRGQQRSRWWWDNAGEESDEDTEGRLYDWTK